MGLSDEQVGRVAAVKFVGFVSGCGGDDLEVGRFELLADPIEVVGLRIDDKYGLGFIHRI
jgi:hypothetical protein